MTQRYSTSLGPCLDEDENVRGAARRGPTASEDVGSVEMDGGAVGATVVDSGGGGSGEG